MQNTIRYALFLLIVTGLVFTACEKEPEEVEDVENVEEVEDTDEPEDSTSSSSTTTPVKTEAAEESSVYEDGTYTASGSYASPAGPESIAVTLTITDDVVSSVSIQKNAANDKSINYQGLFAAGISAQVVGKPLDEIGGYSSVNGSSLTPDGFDAALSSIKAQAAL
jgi:uncharacterized protein with FMN-binding domain